MELVICMQHLYDFLDETPRVPVGTVFTIVALGDDVCDMCDESAEVDDEGTVI